ncbi:MAG: hypothetical protein GF344_16180, partial [Chitinivibrionales bacterium]|nr:hypothetical protein [Chitinivibrionales bacterium]MBD3358230.1 hypothetical protein [Chitinivibrionales bacterium]
MWNRCGYMICATVLGLGVHSARAAMIEYDVTQLTADRWQYSYRLDNFDVAEGKGFTLYYRYELYDNLVVESSPAGWDVISWDPEIILESEESGAVDALAISDEAST